MASIIQVYKHSTTIEVSHVSGGITRWRDIERIQESADPLSELLKEYDVIYDAWTTEGSVSVVQTPGNDITPVILECLVGLNTGAAVDLTLITMNDLGVRDPDVFIHVDIAARTDHGQVISRLTQEILTNAHRPLIPARGTATDDLTQALFRTEGIGELVSMTDLVVTPGEIPPTEPDPL